MSRKFLHEEDRNDKTGDRTDESVPSDEGTDLQIVPVSDKEVNEEDARRERYNIYDILKSGVGLPWVQQSKKIRGRA